MGSVVKVYDLSNTSREGVIKMNVEAEFCQVRSIKTANFYIEEK